MVKRLIIRRFVIQSILSENFMVLSGLFSALNTTRLDGLYPKLAFWLGLRFGLVNFSTSGEIIFDAHFAVTEKK
jgi:hypothetical protein